LVRWARKLQALKEPVTAHLIFNLTATGKRGIRADFGAHSDLYSFYVYCILITLECSNDAFGCKYGTKKGDILPVVGNFYFFVLARFCSFTCKSLLLVTTESIFTKFHVVFINTIRCNYEFLIFLLQNDNYGNKKSETLQTTYKYIHLKMFMKIFWILSDNKWIHV
jgi:hypothetical protein